MQNIGADNAGDQFYRYKMPKLQAKIEGRGNGIKTNVVNCVDIAKALERDPAYIVKYFGCELGALSKFEAGTGVAIVNGAHDARKLSEILEGFIKKYVQCYSCGNPETRIKVKKDMIFLTCKACGAKSDVDMRHKLNTYITKNPPEDKLSKEEKRLKKQEKERMMEAEKAAKDAEKERKKREKAEKKKRKEEEEQAAAAGGAAGTETEPAELLEAGKEAEDEEDENTVWMTDTSEAAAMERAQQQLTAAAAALVLGSSASQVVQDEADHNGNADDGESAPDEPPADTRQGQAAVEDEDDDQVDSLTRLRRCMKKNGPLKVKEWLKELPVPDGAPGRMRLLYEAVLGQAQGSLDRELQAHKNYFRVHSALDDGSADMKGQAAQLVALEHFLATQPGAVSQSAHVLKMTYDLDIIEESILVGWADNLSIGKILSIPPAASKKVREVAAPFISWLKEAETDDEDSEAEEGGDKGADGDDDDIDLDNI